MKKIKVVFVRSFLPQLDSRMLKYADALYQHGDSMCFVGWDRCKTKVPLPDGEVHLFRGRGTIGGRWKNFIALILWNFYILKSLISMRQRVSVVHAVDLDCAIPVWIFCRLFKKVFVFDIYDHYADTRDIKGLGRRLLSDVERHLAQHADLTLLVDDSRYAQHRLPKADNILVIENVPKNSVEIRSLDLADDDVVRIGYLGIFEPKNRGLENLLEAFAGKAGVELHLAGYGGLESRIRCAASAFSNVSYHGALGHSDGLNMLADMHCIIGFYYLSVPNHRYAAPNKYYEHLLLGRPLLTTQGTPPGDKVDRYETGWSLDETTDGLIEWFDTLDFLELVKRGHNARELWEKKYKNYVHDTYGKIYISTVIALSEQRHASSLS